MRDAVTNFARHSVITSELAYAYVRRVVRSVNEILYLIGVPYRYDATKTLAYAQQFRFLFPDKAKRFAGDTPHEFFWILSGNCGAERECRRSFLNLLHSLTIVMGDSEVQHEGRKCETTCLQLAALEAHFLAVVNKED